MNMTWKKLAGFLSSLAEGANEVADALEPPGEDQVQNMYNKLDAPLITVTPMVQDKELAEAMVEDEELRIQYEQTMAVVEALNNKLAGGG